MNVQVTIIDEDPDSRAQLKAALSRENIPGCDISEKAGKGANIWLGDKVAPTALKIGENDSFTKPVRLGALLDRVRRLQAGGKATTKKIRIGPYELDAASNELLADEDRAIRITEKEKQLLVLL